MIVLILTISSDSTAMIFFLFLTCIAIVVYVSYWIIVAKLFYGLRHLISTCSGGMLMPEQHLLHNTRSDEEE